MRKQTIKILYPKEQLNGRKLVLRNSLSDWNFDLLPQRVRGDLHEFDVPTLEPYFHFKPCLVAKDKSPLWSQGGNYLAPVASQRFIYPHFRTPDKGSISDVQILGSGDSENRYRVYLPPGYQENSLRSYPVCYMHDGHNLFFPEEAFAGQTWKVNRTLELLDRMNSIESCIVVAIYPRDRLTDYTMPGAVDYASFLRNELLPTIEQRYRTLQAPEHRVVMGSSLGGLVSFYLVWHHNDVFGRAACLSSTFGYDKRLFRSVSRSSVKRHLRVYLDSGWPGDNFAVTQAMTHLLQSKGYALGKDMHYVAVPEADHSENAWASRLHLPFQFLLGLAYGCDATIDAPPLSRVA
jgi:predicted alpha/beta superfamily hydrolase